MVSKSPLLRYDTRMNCTTSTLSTRILFSVACTLALVACRQAPVVVPPTEQDSSSSMTTSSSSSVEISDKEVIIESPEVNALVMSPLLVRGKARGFWFLEASLPVQLRDANNNVIMTVPATANGEWMTTDYVEFTATLRFTTTATSGFLVIKKDNPSGLPENDAEVKIPVNF